MSKPNDDALRQACRALVKQIESIATMDSDQRRASLECVLHFACTQQAEGLEEGARVVTGLVGKDCGNWNRAIVYATDAIKKRAKEIEP